MKTVALNILAITENKLSEEQYFINICWTIDNSKKVRRKLTLSQKYEIE